jgi:hypothetical protein
MSFSFVKSFVLLALLGLLGGCACCNPWAQKATADKKGHDLSGVPTPLWTKYSPKCWGGERIKSQNGYGYTTVCTPAKKLAGCSDTDWKLIQSDNAIIPPRCKADEGVPTPAYLQYMSCFSVKKVDSHMSVCTPKNKPKACSDMDWKTVNTQKNFPGKC